MLRPSSAWNILTTFVVALLLCSCRGGSQPTPEIATLSVTIVGSGTVQPMGGAYAVGTTVILTAYPDAYWRFDRWNGDAEGRKNQIELEIRADTAVTAVFVALAEDSTLPSTPTPTATPFPAIPVTIDIDTNQDRVNISPYIYGTNSDMGLDLFTFRRLGGNRMTGYNWKTNASNAGSDWDHYSDNFMCEIFDLKDECNTVGSVITTWHDQSLAMSAMSQLTLQMAGYVAADMNKTVTEEEIAPSPRWNAAPFAKRSSVATELGETDGTVSIGEQVSFLVSRYGDASTPSGVKIYGLDNEPDLWSHTHPRIIPNPIGAAELITRSTALATVIKEIDPNALVFGYESYGFYGYYSLQNAPDWQHVKGEYSWYIDYYLDQMKQQGDAAGMRLLDGLSLHWYPEAQGGGQRIVGAGVGNTDVQKARVQAPRSLWDPTYIETSWIAQRFPGYLPLIPRLRKSIDTYYPGTHLAFTEFSYGGESHISGGLAMADILGIFGKYGVYSAAYWPMEADQSYIRAAYRLFRDYDGAGSTYGDTAVRATTSHIADLSVYASIFGSDDTTLHIIVLNKNFDISADLCFTVVGDRTYLSGEVWAFDAASAEITQRGRITAIANDHFPYTLQPLTAAHIILRALDE
jgi:hypothetical protein